MVEALYHPKTQDAGEAAYWRFVSILEQGDPIPHAWVARAMLIGNPVTPDEAGEVAREWAALDLLAEWREALDYVRREILGGTEYFADVRPPPGMRKRGSALEAILEGIGDDVRGAWQALASGARLPLLVVGAAAVAVAAAFLWGRR